MLSSGNSDPAALSRLVTPLLHPSPLPHTDSLGVPNWVQWLVAAILVTFVGWISIDLRRARRPPQESPLPVARPGSRERLVARSTIGSPRTARPGSSQARPAVGARILLSLQVLIFTIAGLLGWYALDRARGVDAFAGFVASAGTINAVRLSFACAALFWVGGALALVSPKGAAIAFAASGIISLSLINATRWEERVEWWGLAAAASRWSSLSIWSATAFVLAVACLLIGMRSTR